MESIEDDVVLPISEDPPSPIHKPKLKRLKKSSSSATADSIRVSDDPVVPDRDSSASVSSESKDPDDLYPLLSMPSDDPIVPSSASPMYGSRDSGGRKEFEDNLDPLFSVPAVDAGFEILDMERETEEKEEEEGGRFKKIGELGSGIEEKSSRKRLNSYSPISGSKDFGAEKELEDDLDPLFSVPASDEGFETLDDLEGERKDDEGFKKSGEIGSGIEKEKSVRKRLNLDDGSEDISKKRRKKKKSKDDDKLGEKSKESVREKRRNEMERMAQLEQIHAESQRLLRETRDASFKPVPVVQKSISSVLEKIRLRKLEVLKQTSILCQSDSVSASDCLMDEVVQKNSNPVRIQNDSRDNKGDAEVNDFAHIQNVGSYGSSHVPCGEIPSNNDSDLELKDASPTLISVTHEATQAVQSKYGDNNQLDDLEDNSDSPLPASKLTPIPDDLSSEEEDDDNGNIDPQTFGAVNMASSPEDGGLAKAFLDDEAEEEDDSDHDHMRFEDNEDDDESDADEVLNDLIATGYEEAPVDHEKRNQLHQKWLEQQDAAGTDDILQRLKYGQKQKEPTGLHDEDDDNDDHDDDDDDDDDFGDESADEKSQDPPVTDDARQNSKKAKQMIAQMFTDADDSYIHSDDEESEQTLLRQHILKQTSESSFISPVEDEHSREVFGLIKKLNIAPVTKKRGKAATSSFDSLVMGANSNSASKSSFLNRTNSTSLPSLHKQASTTVRAFIFGRDDSNSRSGISPSESTSDMDPKENHPSKPAASKVNSGSQFKSTAKTKIEAHTGSASGSLFQILRHSSVQFDKQLNKNGTSHQEITETQAAYQFSAFKLGKRAAKIESRIS